MTVERRVGLDELVRTVNRIDGRTARLEAAFFEEKGMVTRLIVLEGKVKNDEDERRLNRIMAAVATLVGSSLGSIAGIITLHR